MNTQVAEGVHRLTAGVANFYLVTDGGSDRHTPKTPVTGLVSATSAAEAARNSTISAAFRQGSGHRSLAFGAMPMPQTAGTGQEVTEMPDLMSGPPHLLHLWCRAETNKC